jgi:hypothetical protein
MRTMLRYCVVAALALAGCANQALQKAQQAYATGLQPARRGSRERRRWPLPTV